MYRNPAKASAMIAEIRRDLEERGCTDIVLHRGGDDIHISAIDPKRKRKIDVYGKPYQEEK